MLHSQNYVKLENLKSDFVKSENKEKYYSELVNNIEIVFSSEKISSQDIWIKKLYDAQSIMLKNNFVYNGLKSALQEDVDKRKKLQQIALEVAYSLYDKEFTEDILKINDYTKDPASFALSSLYLFRAGNMQKSELFKLLEEKFPNYDKNTILNALYDDLQGLDNYLNNDELKNLFNHQFQKGKTIIYSIHRKNRQFPGITIIKKPDGKFLKNEDGTVFSIPQLGLSYSNLPYYIPNGNTPQGIYSIIGWYISPTETIGPTPNILVRSPFEVDPRIFFHGENKFKSWNIEDYQSLLPATLHNYNPLYQSYTAGKIGRKLIIMHGSTDETDFFKEKRYYPLTPTRGCLSSTEIWSEETGKCIKSDQVELINKFRSIKEKEGFLVVIEIDNQEKPIEISEIENFLNK